MKEYKLIKEYPNSLKLGTVVKDKDNTFYFYEDENGNGVDYDPSKHPEYWELVTNKNYEILDFIATKAHGKEGHIVDTFNTGDHNKLQDYISNTSWWKINSVKRVKDNQVFKVGDKIGHTIVKSEASKITSINLIKDKIYFSTEDCDSKKGTALSCAIKSKPLFTTQDGVDIYEGDRYYWVNRKRKYLDVLSCEASSKYFYNDINFLHFSTKEAAKKWIYYNKPMLSLNEILDTLSSGSLNKNVTNFINLTKYKYENPTN